MDCAAHIYRELGVRGFFRGYVVNIVGVIPYAGIELATYEVSHLLFSFRSSLFVLFLRFFFDILVAKIDLHTPLHESYSTALTSCLS